MELRRLTRITLSKRCLLRKQQGVLRMSSVSTSSIHWWTTVIALPEILLRSTNCLSTMLWMQLLGEILSSNSKSVRSFVRSRPKRTSSRKSTRCWMMWWWSSRRQMKFHRTRMSWINAGKKLRADRALDTQVFPLSSLHWTIMRPLSVENCLSLVQSKSKARVWCFWIAQLTCWSRITQSSIWIVS